MYITRFACLCDNFSISDLGHTQGSNVNIFFNGRWYQSTKTKIGRLKEQNFYRLLCHSLTSQKLSVKQVMILILKMHKSCHQAS